MRKANGIPAGDVTWSALKIGAGGFAPSIKFSNDGATRLCRTDVGGAYKWNATTDRWDQLLTADRMPAGYDTVADVWEGTGAYIDSYGVYEIAVAPQDANYIVMAFASYLFQSINGGQTFFAIPAWTRKSMRSNFGMARLSSDKIAIDPTDKDVWYICTENELWITLNGGVSFAKATTVPDSTGTNRNCMLVAIDASSALTGGRHSIVHVYSSNSGAYRSTDGGGSFTQTKAETGRYPLQLRVDENGQAYLVTRALTDTGGRLDRCVGTTWTTLSGTGGLTLADIANVVVDPLDANRVIIMEGSGYAQMSTDNCVTWSNGNIWYASKWLGHVLGGDVPWIVNEVNTRNFLAISDIRFDPISHDLYAAMGIGILKLDFPAAYSGTAWLAYTIECAGIEELVGHRVTTIPNGPIICQSHDRPVFVSNDPNDYPATYWNNNFTITWGWDADYARDDANFIAVLNSGGGAKPGYSLNKGATFQIFPTDITSLGLGGGIAVSNKNNILVFPGQNARPRHTFDTGTTWAEPSFPAEVPLSGESGWGFGWLDNLRHIITADKAAGAGIFYCYNYLSACGVYKSTDNGANFTKVSGHPVSSSLTGYHVTMAAVPGNANHLFFATGPVGGPPTEQPGADFMRSTNGGVNWTKVLGNLSTGAAITTFTEVIFGFGKAAPDLTYPAIYAAGWVNGVYGLYRSDDNCVTWKSLTLPGVIDEIRSVSGDLDVYGRVILAFSGNGFMVGNYRTWILGY